MPSSFTTNDKIYKQKKQILSSSFAPRKLEATEPLIRLHVDKFCEIIAAAKNVDIAVMLGALSMDVLSALCFGQSFDTLADEPERDRILEAMEQSVQLVIRVSKPLLCSQARGTDFFEGRNHAQMATCYLEVPSCKGRCEKAGIRLSGVSTDLPLTVL